jgi:hypothetical protein
MKKQYTPDKSEYQLTDHCCRICLGRILRQIHYEHLPIHKCSNCGVEVISAHVHGLCCCGMKLRNGKNANMRCIVNTKKCPEQPSEIVVVQVEENIVA